jgi:hypothetical protein
MTLQTHLHRRLLHSIVEALQRLSKGVSGKVHLLKVKAHSGVIGNECADVIAKQAACTAAGCDINIQYAEDPFADRVWVRSKPHNPDEPIQTFPNAGPALKQHIVYISRMGAANIQSIYYQLWQKVAEAATPGSLSQVMTDSRITAGQRKLALQYRNGNLYNQKHALRCNKASSPNCLCCGNPDLATHMLQGPCTQAHSNLVGKRHHEAVGIIASAILEGGRGGDLCFADVSDNVAEKLGLDTGGWKERWKDLKKVLAGSPDAHGSRPDMVMLQEPRSPNDLMEVTLVEVKYCADTSW